MNQIIHTNHITECQNNFGLSFLLLTLDFLSCECENTRFKDTKFPIDFSLAWPTSLTIRCVLRRLMWNGDDLRLFGQSDENESESEGYKMMRSRLSAEFKIKKDIFTNSKKEKWNNLLKLFNYFSWARHPVDDCWPDTPADQHINTREMEFLRIVVRC